nr:cholinesterase-like [Rhipicephalus microplus]
MEAANKTDGETTTTHANSQGPSGSKSRKRSKSRDGKSRRASSTDDGLVNNQDTQSSNDTRKKSRKSIDKGVQEVGKPPEATAVAPAALPPSSTLTEQQAQKSAAADHPTPARGGPSAAQYGGAAPVVNERKPGRACLGAAVTVAVIFLGLVAALVGIVISAPPQDVAVVCRPLDKPLPEGTVMVASKKGRLLGRIVSANGVLLYRFLGVPFAQSTSGVRRFLVPLPMGAHQDPCKVRECLEPRPPCSQWHNGSVLGSEDCLHVNVWMPASASNDSGRRRAVVVAVSGSWFETGSNDHPDWPMLAAKGDVVVMAPNHRHGMLGFLHPPPVPGMVQDPAVDDVVAAVLWARDNADTFGADPKQLVLVGRGSGAYLLSMASNSLPNDTASRAFYHGIVYGSLLPLDPADRKEPYHSLASALQCNVTADEGANASTWLPCFRAASADDMVRAAREFSDFPLRFAPRVDISSLQATPAGRTHTVIAGSDTAEARDLFMQRILPLAKRHGNASTTEALVDYTLNVFNIPSFVKSFLRGRLNVNSVEDLARKFPLVVSTCATLRVATAAVEGYHYLIDSNVSSGSLQPPLGIQQVAQFASNG